VHSAAFLLLQLSLNFCATHSVGCALCWRAVLWGTVLWGAAI